MMTTPQEPGRSDDDPVKREMSQRAVNDDRAAKNPETDPQATTHPVGEDQARVNADNESAS